MAEKRFRADAGEEGDGELSAERLILSIRLQLQNGSKRMSECRDRMELKLSEK